MKYIRTENGIDLLRKAIDKYIVKDSDYSCEIVIDKETLLKNYKVADTIEELCDEFVFVEFGVFNDKEYHFKTLEESKKCNELYDRCYGAIHTDKGLIYVAILNDKGEFELL